MNQIEYIYLPLCDLLFNIISLLSYFSDIVFDLLAVYTLYVDARYGWFAFTLGCIVASTLACQVMSMRWHLRERRLDHHQQHRLSKSGGGIIGGVASTVLLVHVLQCGVLWRYFRLFMPVDLRRVKRAVRDLCILRLIHLGGAAGPMLLVHFYLGWTTMDARSPSDLTRLHVVSTSLCMFSACWALASFSKHIRQQNLHRLVLTWLGVIYQFLWRLGTVSSRVAALTLYATVYNFWVLLVIALHWFSMCLWLASNFPFRGEKLSRTRKCALSLLVTYVYVFCYLHVDLQETSNARAKMITFYVTVFFENTLLLALWWHGHNSDQTPAWHRSAGVLLVWGAFLFGIVFMLLYYRYFHVTRLKHGLMPVDYGSWPPSMTQATSGHLQSCALCRLGTTACLEHYDQCGGEYSPVASSNHQHNHNSIKGGGATTSTLPQFNHQHRHSHHHHHHHHHHAAAAAAATQNMMEHAQQKGGGGAGGVAYIQLPGVFNCRLNPAFKRKKKKPTTFIPVPFQALATVQTNGKAVIPFWKKQPAQQVFTAEAVTVDPIQEQRQQQQDKASSPETSVDMMQKNIGGASRVDIQQKLMEKRQKQLQELRVIEEEIKQGKFQRPHPSDLSEQGTLRQPIPRLKKQPVQEESSAVAVLVDQIQIQQTPSSRKTNEILLTPHCLDNNNGSGSSGTMVYYDYWEEKWRFAPPTLRQQCPSVGGGGQHQWRQSNGCGGNGGGGVPSDLDSQASLPRSFTLPREFRYNRKSKARRVVRSEHFVTSTNSSDGDVDSADENDSGGEANRRNNLSSPTVDETCHNHRYHRQQQQQHLSSALDQQEIVESAPQVTAPPSQIRIATPSNLFHHHHHLLIHHPLQGRSAYNRHETQL